MRRKIGVGSRYGKLVASEYLGGSKWKCRCDCGNDKVVTGGHLNRGKATHCGCLNLRIRDLSGQRFGKLVPVEVVSRSRNGNVKWRCRCDCGNVTDVLSTHLVSHGTRSCGCARLFGRFHKLWTGHEEITGQFWGNVRRGADGTKGRRRVDFEVTIEQAWDEFVKQDRRCALTGLPLSFPCRYNDSSGTASLDRIDSERGYVVSNIQWVHKDMNKMKNCFSQGYFIEMCGLVAKRFNKDLTK